MSSLVVNEIFHSIQGESSFSGRPCVFIRLTHCNLRCTYCDTAYAFEEGENMEIGEILRRVESYGCRLVEVTGGEPLLQAPVHDLLRSLCDRGFETLLETGGSLDIGMVDPRVRKIVDLKCPGSGMTKRNLWSNVDKLRPTDEVKFVVGSREDFEWAVETMRGYELERRCAVLFSPVFGEVSPATMAEWILASGVNARMQLQLHKYIWAPETRGV